VRSGEATAAGFGGRVGVEEIKHRKKLTTDEYG
jgi:hypothetical protein